MYGEPLPVAQSVEPKRSRAGLWVLLAGGVALLLVLVCAGVGAAVVNSFSQSINVASDEVDAVFDDIELGRFADSYSTKFSSAYRKETTAQQHAEIGQTCQRALGRLQSKTMHSMHRQSLNGRACINATYNGQFEKGAGTIKVTLAWEGGEWKFQGFQVQSQALAATLKCANCGAAHGIDAKFCPKCGKEILGGK